MDVCQAELIAAFSSPVFLSQCSKPCEYTVMDSSVEDEQTVGVTRHPKRPQIAPKAPLAALTPRDR
jgi:hypothetical protein